MSLLFRQVREIGDPGYPLYPARNYTPVGTIAVSPESAMRHSAVWAAVRLRADMVSSIPLVGYRQVGDQRVVLPSLPAVLTSPGGVDMSMMEWLYSSQVDLDRYGNTFGMIRSRDAMGIPSRIDLISAQEMRVQSYKGSVTYTIAGKKQDTADIWHEKQYTVAGLPMGMSPITYAALTVGQYISAQQFAADWFTQGKVPKGHLRNTAKAFGAPEAQAVKDRFNSIYARGGVFVSGSDWEFNPIAAQANDTAWLESMHASGVDIARFMGVPADLIEAGAKSTSTIVYANITQLNLQFLIINLGPLLGRRESVFSRKLMPAPRFVKFDTDTSLMRMDPLTRSSYVSGLLTAKRITPTEGRAMDQRLPFTPEQLAEIDALYGSAAPPAGPTDPAMPAAPPPDDMPTTPTGMPDMSGVNP